MAVSVVGTGTFIKSTNNGQACTLTFSTGGAAAGDIVIANWVSPRGGTVSSSPVFSSAGTAYTNIGFASNPNSYLGSWYRVLTSSETTVQSCATGSAQDAIVLSAIVLRGFASPPTIQYVSTIATSTSWNSAALTETAPNSAFITAVAGGAGSGAITLTAPSGALNPLSIGVTDTRSANSGVAWYQGTGTVDPNPWGSTASFAWVAATISLASTEAATVTWLDMASQSTHNPPACIWGGKPDVVGY